MPTAIVWAYSATCPDAFRRLDNGAGRCLLLRYDRQHLIAVDYQAHSPD